MNFICDLSDSVGEIDIVLGGVGGVGVKSNPLLFR